MSNGLKNLTSVVRKLTHAGAWAQYYREYPDELPHYAPDPETQPAEFASWAKRNLPAIKQYSEVKE